MGNFENQNQGVNVNVIPTNLIERVEVLKEGAGALYGSDAVGGVVNFVTRTDFDGLEIGYEHGVSERGDGNLDTVDVAWGAEGERGGIMLSATYQKQDEISAGDRSYTKEAIYFYVYVFPGGSSRAPTGRIRIPFENPLWGQLDGCGADLSDPDDQGPISVTRIGGTSGASPSDYRCFTGGDLYNYQPFNLVLTPQERASFFTQANYDINENVEAYAELLHNYTTSGFTIAPLPLDARSDTIVIPAENVYNPFGENFGASGSDVFSQAQWRLEGLGLLPIRMTPPSACARRFLIVDGTQVTQRRVSAPGIVEPLDVVEHIGLGLRAGPIVGTVCTLDLERREEALHRRIVPAVTTAAHAAGHAVLAQRPLELLAGVLAALVGMMQQRAAGAASPDRHQHRVDDELRGHLRAHRPADHAAREQIQHHRHIQPTLGGPQVGEVGDPFGVGAAGGELPVQDVGGNGVLRSQPVIAGQTPPSGAGHQLRPAHQPLHAMDAAAVPPVAQIATHAARAVGAIAFGETGANRRRQLRIALRVGALGALQPGVKATPRHRQRLAQPGQRPGPPMPGNHCEPHVGSFAK